MRRIFRCLRADAIVSCSGYHSGWPAPSSWLPGRGRGFLTDGVGRIAGPFEQSLSDILSMTLPLSTTQEVLLPQNALFLHGRSKEAADPGERLQMQLDRHLDQEKHLPPSLKVHLVEDRGLAHALAHARDEPLAAAARAAADWAGQARCSGEQEVGEEGLSEEEGSGGLACSTKRTYQPGNLVRKRRHGFLSRVRSRGGRRVVGRRLAKGRRRVTA